MVNKSIPTLGNSPANKLKPRLLEGRNCMSDGNHKNVHSFSADWNAESIEQFADNRGFDTKSEYIRFLIRNDVQNQMTEGDLELVPTND